MKLKRRKHNLTAAEVVEEKHEKTIAECWKWLGQINDGGYGIVYWHGKQVRAHRLSYEAHIGPIPHGLELDHLCRNRSCINPKHLEPVTRLENVRRGVGISVQMSKKTHCIRGHLYTAETTRIRSRGNSTTRECITCYPCRPKKEKTHCFRGHALTEKNIYYRPSSSKCKTCKECKMIMDTLSRIKRTTILFVKNVES